MRNNRSSIFSFIACAVFLFYTCFSFYPKWTKAGTEATISWDVSGYYWYLPTVFIYKDIRHQSFGDSIASKYTPAPDFQQSYVLPNGNRVINYTCGMAVMYLPLFAAAHIAAPALGYPPDGFSTPYQFALQAGSLLVALLGLWQFRKLLLLYYNDTVTALMLLLLTFGTNYLNYSAIDGAQTHTWLFTLYVLLLLNTHHFYNRQTIKYALRIGAICGLMLLTRPSEIIAILIPLLWGMEHISSAGIKKQLRFLNMQRNKILLAACVVTVIGIVQVIYWYYVAGKPFVYSYQDHGFSWLHPHFYDYMFSYRSGWLVYTPLLMLSFAGIIPFVKYGKHKVAILCFFAINLYIVSAWDVWWYGGTGGRAMLQSYPVILFPMAALLQYVMQRRILLWCLAPFLLLFTYFNIWFTYNAHAGEGLYDPEGMSGPYFWAVAGKWHVNKEAQKLKDTDELFTGTPQNLTAVYSNTFENDTVFNPALPPIESLRSLYIKPHSTSPAYTFPVNTGTAIWIRVQATFKCNQKELTVWKMLQLVVQLNNKENTIKQRILRIHRMIDKGETKYLFRHQTACRSCR